MTERHIMIDLETMSTRPTASVVAIGAYMFDPYSDDREGMDTSRAHYVTFPLNDSIRAGLHVDGATVEWWMGQTPKARAALTDYRNDLKSGLMMLRTFMWYGRTGQDLKMRPEQMVVWAHGSFDIPILEHAYLQTDSTPLPWHYRSPRDLRTIIHAAYGKNLDLDEVEPDFPVNPVEHHAMYDAWHQAVMVQYCFRRLGLVEGTKHE